MVAGYIEKKKKNETEKQYNALTVKRKLLLGKVSLTWIDT